MSKINIVVVGDEKSGKSSLINSFIKEEFEEDLPQILPKITIPAEITVDHVDTYIIDTNASTQMIHLKDSLYEAHVVCIVYDSNDTESLDRISSFWMPLVRSNTKTVVPVILVCNKIDMNKRRLSNASFMSQNQGGNAQIMQLMEVYKEIESCIEVSCKELLNVAEVFYFCNRSVLHPLFPLWDPQLHQFKSVAVQALERIFKLCDLDNDNLLDDTELNKFQRKVFGSPLQAQELEGVKDVVKQGLPGKGVINSALTSDGFVYLHSLFVQRGRMETIWKVLRKFGYNQNVELDQSFLNPTISVGIDDKTELSPKGYQFLIDLFRRFDQDYNGSLSEIEINKLFSTCPVYNGTQIPWSNYLDRSVCNVNEITLQGFLALWSMTTLLDYNKTLAYLAYLGYDGDTRNAIKIIQNQKYGTTKKKSPRNVFRCLVIGAKGCGKTQFCRVLVDKPFNSHYNPNLRATNYVNSVDCHGSEKYLVLQEVEVDQVSILLEDQKIINQVDALIFMYDTSDVNSFNYLVQLRKQHLLESIPSIYIGTKNDLGTVKQESILQPVDYCQKLKIKPPLVISCKSKQLNDVFSVIMDVCLNPIDSIPHSNYQLSKVAPKKVSWFLLGGIASTITIGSFVILRRYPSLIRNIVHGLTKITSLFSRWQKQ